MNFFLQMVNGTTHIFEAITKECPWYSKKVGNSSILGCWGQIVEYHCPASSPGPSPRSKWWSEKPLAKAAEILHESWSILWRDTWWNDFFGGCSQRLAALFVFCNWKPLYKQNEDISSCLRDEILTHFWSLGLGSDRHFERGEGPGDEVVSLPASS